jgi:hypothetical protein
MKIRRTMKLIMIRNFQRDISSSVRIIFMFLSSLGADQRPGTNRKLSLGQKKG